MSEYTPTADEVRQSFATNPPGDKWHPHREVHREAFDRWLAEVRRQAAEEALLKAADAFEGGEINIEIFGDSVEARLWRMSNQTRSSLVKSLRARAAAYRREETE